MDQAFTENEEAILLMSLEMLKENLTISLTSIKLMQNSEEPEFKVLQESGQLEEEADIAKELLVDIENIVNKITLRNNKDTSIEPEKPNWG